MALSRTTSPDGVAVPTPSRHRLRVLLWLLPPLLVLGGLPLYVFPAQQLPSHADVAYVLGSPDPWRIDWAEHLASTGRVSAVLISVPGAKQAPSTCSIPQSYPVVCVHPDPATTEGEARALRAMMAAHGWSSAVAITSTPHVLRASLILRQCVPHGVSVVGRTTGIDLGGWIYQYLYQTVALAKALIVPAC